MKHIARPFLWVILPLFALPACQGGGAAGREGAKGVDLLASLLQNNPGLENSSQLLLAFSEQSGSFQGKLFGYEKQGGQWAPAFGPFVVTFGEAGFAAFGEKREGDKKSPTGIFGLGPAFGYEKDIDCKMDFVALTEQHYWISDSEYPDYNQLVTYLPESPEVEKMRRDDEYYEYGVVVRYNMDPVEKYKGSAIFIHLGRGPDDPTLGCIAMDRDKVVQLIQWLDPALNPRIAMGNYGELKGLRH